MKGIKEIVFCVDGLGIGGIEKCLIRLLKALDKLDKYKIKLCIKDSSKLTLLSEVPKKIEVLILGEENKFYFSIINRYAKFRKFKKFIRNAEIIIDYYDGNWYKFFRKVSQKKKIVFFHTILEKLHIYTKIEEVKKIYDEFVVLSEKGKEELKNIGISENKISKIYNIIDVKEIKNKSKEEEVCIEENYYIMIGRIVDDSKDYDTVINLFSNRKINEKLVIIGDGEYKDNLEKKIKKYALEDKVLLLGEKINPYPYLKKAKALIVSSRYEGLSAVILEALVLYVPVVASDCPYGPKEILQDNIEKGLLGELFEIGNEIELLNILLNLEKKVIDKNKIDKRVLEFSEERIVKKLEGLFRKASN